MNAKKTVLSILALLVLIVILQNAAVVSFKILFWQISMSRIVWLLLFVAVGFAAGYALGSVGRKANRKTAGGRPE
ncbi:MAG: LapA family protein [Dehalococcoidia bacterium]|nr:MAG: LapA family protein [Dehalococcoidia bacterium]